MSLSAPSWAGDRGNNDDDDDDNGKVRICKGILPGLICDGTSCLCEKPARYSPSYPWRISRVGYMEWLVCLNMVPLRCPEVFQLDASCQGKFVSKAKRFLQD